MAVVSGVGPFSAPAPPEPSAANLAPACVFGASVICVDVFVRLFPGKHTFRIEESNAFLACSLSLSFGVMVRGPAAAPPERS